MFYSLLTKNSEAPLSNLKILYDAVSVAGEQRGTQRDIPTMQFLKNALQRPGGLWTLPSRR